jgi:hypothetical protein
MVIKIINQMMMMMTIRDIKTTILKMIMITTDNKEKLIINKKEYKNV